MASISKMGRSPRDMPKNQSVSDPIGLMAAEVVVSAITDWRGLIKRKAWLDGYVKHNCNFDELRSFFNGEWCEFLMQDFSMKPKELLQLLEKELQEAKRKDETR
jgi:hypothetical protein